MYWHEDIFETVRNAEKIASELGVALPTLAIAWTLAQPAITAPIIGVSRPEQLDPVLAAVDMSLPQEVIERLDAISRKHRAGDAVV
jgi:aryl-alcohol dehydrogenase (NADP+)